MTCTVTKRLLLTCKRHKLHPLLYVFQRGAVLLPAILCLPPPQGGGPACTWSMKMAVWMTWEIFLAQVRPSVKLPDAQVLGQGVAGLLTKVLLQQAAEAHMTQDWRSVIAKDVAVQQAHLERHQRAHACDADQISRCPPMHASNQ